MTKRDCIKKLCTDKGIIAALAIDQRGAFLKMLPPWEPELAHDFIVSFKRNVASTLTAFSSSILLDPIYGMEAIQYKAPDCGLILAYEVTGYRDERRLPLLLENWSVKRIKDKGAQGVKVLLYYDVDDSWENNDIKKAWIERIGSECRGEEIAFFLEIITYDQNIKDIKGKEFSKLKPHKVNQAIAEFTKEKYQVDVLKVEVPVNMNYVEGFGAEYVHTREEAASFFKEQSDLSTKPFIFLSAGVDSALFLETLRFAHQSGSSFNGVLCGRATWAGGVERFMKSESEGLHWLHTMGRKNIERLHEVLEKTATPIFR